MPSLLLVEDDEKMQKLYQFAFEAAGFEVTIAGSGAEALVRVEDKHINEGLPYNIKDAMRYDVIVLDMMMLGMSGLDFLKAFDRSKNPKTKIIVLTNIDNPNIAEQAIKLGADEYLQKSDYDPQEVAAHVTELLRQLGPSDLKEG